MTSTITPRSELAARRNSQAITPALQRRVCPLLERPSETRILPDAPAPWVLRQCLETGFVFLENPPAYELLEEHFAWESTYEQEVQRRAAAEPISYTLRLKFKQFRLRWMWRDKVSQLATAHLNSLTAEQLTVLELGCGSSFNLLNVMARVPPAVARRCTPLGVEISKKLAAESDLLLHPFGGSCDQDNALSGLERFAPGSVDLLLLVMFLEHETNPLPLLRRCHERLADHGQIVVKVPNYDCLLRHLRGKRWSGFRWPDHVNYFTPRTLQALAQRAGFRIARMRWLDHHPLSDSMYCVLAKA
jgi:SAM-dependent methyltransferase